MLTGGRTYMINGCIAPYRTFYTRSYTLPGEDCPTLNADMAQLTQGLAWHYKPYTHEQSEEDRARYAFAEENAPQLLIR